MTKRSASKRGQKTVSNGETKAPRVPRIEFYRANEKPHGVFSNLYRRPIIFEGRFYPTAEHAYQAGKPAKDSVRDWILSAPTPALVAMAAHGLYTWDITPDWSQIKLERMRQVLRAKFLQHKDLLDLLLSTGNAYLVESGRTDNAVNREWGEVNGKGQNKLGALLMEIRAEHRKAKSQHKTIRRQTSKRNAPISATA